MAYSKTKTNRSAGTQRKNSYFSSVRDLYNCGYRAGYAAYSEMPKVRGGKAALKYGYGKGYSAAKKVDKYQTKARSK